MGSWGSGVFENDDAQDFLGDLMDGLASHVVHTIKGGDAYLGSVGPAAEVMALLAKHCQTAPPPPAEIEAWKSGFVETYQHSNCGGSSNISAQDRYCVNVLASLEALSQIARGFNHEASEPLSPQPSGIGTFHVGMAVSHPKFGAGTLLAIEGSGEAAAGKITFERYGEKWLVLAHANLSPL